MELKQVTELLLTTDKYDERLDLMEELYWAEYDKELPENEIDDLWTTLINSTSKEEFIAVQKLYSNPEGAMLDFYERVILSLYEKDPFIFIDAFTESPDDGNNVLYIFRNRGFFEDFESERDALLKSNENNETRDKIELFFKLYDSVCHT